MSDQMPQKSPSHNNSKISRRNLEENFENWNIYMVEDVSSGIEYGLDWIIEIVKEGGAVTGRYCGVQSKALEGKRSFNSSNIKTTLYRTTINYLYAISASMPVLLHFYDKKKTKASYVIQFNEWYEQNYSNFGDKKEITVNIPFSNRLNESIALKIEEHINAFYDAREINKAIDLVNRLNPNQFVDIVKIEENHIYLKLGARSEAGKLTLIPLTEETERLIQHANTTGESVLLKDGFSISPIPSEFRNLVISGILIEHDLTLIPALHLSISWLNISKEVLYEVRHIEMKCTKLGKDLQVWSGGHLKSGVNFILHLNANGAFKSLNFEAFNSPKDSDELLRYSQFLRKSIEATLLRIENLNEEKPVNDILINRHEFKDSLAASANPLAKLIDIAKKLNIKFTLPTDEQNNSTLHAINIAHEAIFNGRYPKLLWDREVDDFELLSDPSWDWEEANIIAQAYIDQNEYVYYDDSASPVNILGQVIDLGPKEYLLVDLRLINHEELKQAILNKISINRLHFGFDRTKSYTQFPNWLPPERE